jgi:hypothetical protein
MTSLVALAGDVMARHGWLIRYEAGLEGSRLRFDLVAESPTAIVFVEDVETEGLRKQADALASAIAAITLGQSAGVKAWEAYLVLIVGRGYDEIDLLAQEIQRDLNYCRKIVLDGESISASDDTHAAMERALAFLLPVEAALSPGVEDARQHLIASLVGHGIDEALATEIVTAFDTEPDCKCWDRIERLVAHEAGQP